jgi:8-oxo-dGTP pyrophosphatase MutT (NUDIX family)
MFARLPAPVHRVALKLAHRVRLRVWGWLRLEVRGTNALVFDREGRVLLVRHSYHLSAQWMFPGGGLARGEDPVQTATREVREETGCMLADAVWFDTVLRPFPSGWTNRIELIAGTTDDLPRVDGRELEEAAFFALDALPAGANAATRDSIARWRTWRESEG